MIDNDLDSVLNEIQSKLTNPKKSTLEESVDTVEVESDIKSVDLTINKLDEDLEAIQHSIFLRGFFKRKARALKSNK